MNKKGKSNIVVIIVIALLLIAGIYYYISSTHIKTITEHAIPADISKGESGTGLKLSLFNCPEDLLNKPIITAEESLRCRKIEIPSWFSSQNVLQDYAIVKSPSPSPCPSGLRTECANYATNPDIMCWNSQCVLGNTNSLRLSYSIKNEGSQGIVFNNVQVTSASPGVFNSSVNKTMVNGLGPGQTASFAMGPLMSISANGWIGTNQTFILNASGISNYDGLTTKTGDLVILGFYPDPSGSLSITIVKVV
jgi:hypothetical protein